MAQKPIDQIVKGYWAHYEATRSLDRTHRAETEPNFWAWEAVDDEVRAPSDRVFELLLTLAHEAKDDEALGYLGAGPVEDLVAWHGTRYLDEIEKWARRDPAFRKALSNIWITTDLPAPVRERLAPFIATPPFQP